MSKNKDNTNPPQSTSKSQDGYSREFREFLDELKEKLTDYLEELGVFLFPSGETFGCLCPIHDDTRPSFSIYGAAHQYWKCFACDKGGDMFDLSIALGRSKTFPEAVSEVCETLGIPAPKFKGGTKPFSPLPRREKVGRSANPPETSEEEDAFRWVARHNLREAIHKNPEKVEAIARDLGIPSWVIKRAARGRSGLGLVRGNLAYVYPVGIKTRRPAGCTPRFIWEYGRAYGPWRTDRIKPSTETIYVTEGESDALALLATGLEDDGKSVVIASPGTSFQKGWVHLFAGKNVVLCFDFDEPGQRAAEKVAQLLSDHAASVRIVRP